MRTILFRGERTDGGGWVEGAYLSHIDTNKIIVKDGDADSVFIFHTVKPQTVAQYIGRDDINGRKIFEGMRVRATDNMPDGVEPFEGVVIFTNCSFAIKSGHTIHYRWMDYEVEVIG